MALIVENYGNGQLGDVTTVSSVINSYARVTSLTSTTVTINESTKYSGAASFDVGAKIFFHVSATTGSENTKYLGKWAVANVINKEANVLIVDEDLTQIIPSEQLSKYYVQVVAIAQYKNLTVSTGTSITPPIYNTSSYHGGIVAIMCSEKLTFAGGHILLSDRGIPVTNKALRPLLKQESAGTLDTNKYAGWENYCAETFPLNAGDGAVFIMAKSVTCDVNSRIGNVSTYGVQWCRGATDSSPASPSKATNIGGSSIFMAAETIENFQVKMIAKYRANTATVGQGLGRCYIASSTKLMHDEGLYSYDLISDPSHIKSMNIKNFGDGSFGDIIDPTIQLNNYAQITAVNGTKLKYTGKTTTGLAPLSVGALVMVHYNTYSTYASNIHGAGRFILAKVLSDDGTYITIDTEPMPDLAGIKISNYKAQIISIPQAYNFKLSTENAATINFSNNRGGIFAIAVKNECDLSNGIINVNRKGTNTTAYGSNGLAVIGNTHNSNKLPIGTGHGSVFILAKTLIMNTSTRIGDIYSGANFGGATLDAKDKITIVGGGYKGGGDYPGKGGGAGNNGGRAGSGSYYSTYDGKTYTRNNQGAHIMIVADTIKNFNQAAISTGGENYKDKDLTNGGAGYGGSGGQGGGGYISGGGYNNYTAGGGGSGWAFIYCNNAVNQDTTATIYED